MKNLIALGAFALLTLPASQALAVPMCDGPDFSVLDSNGLPFYSEEDEARRDEMILRSRGINAHQTRWWNGCLQTFVTVNGRDEMQFYDPNTFRRVY